MENRPWVIVVMDESAPSVIGPFESSDAAAKVGNKLAESFPVKIASLNPIPRELL